MGGIAWTVSEIIELSLFSWLRYVWAWMKVKVNIMNTWCILMSEAVTVASLMMMMTLLVVSEESLNCENRHYRQTDARTHACTTTHTHTHTHTHGQTLWLRLVYFQLVQSRNSHSEPRAWLSENKNQTSKHRLKKVKSWPLFSPPRPLLFSSSSKFTFSRPTQKQLCQRNCIFQRATNSKIRLIYNCSWREHGRAYP